LLDNLPEGSEEERILSEVTVPAPFPECDEPLSVGDGEELEEGDEVCNAATLHIRGGAAFSIVGVSVLTVATGLTPLDE
jgi:hypothetical protein